MAAFTSSQPPLPTFGHVEGTDSTPAMKPAFLLEFLEHALEDFENDAPQIKDELMARRTTLFSLATHVSGKFPYPDEQLKLWHAMHEHLKLAETILLVIHSGTRKFDRFFSHPIDFVMGIMHCLLRIAVVADRWTELPVERHEKYLNPDDMRTKAMEVATDYLNSIGKMSPPLVDKKQEKDLRGFSPLYEIQKRLLGEFLDTCGDLLASGMIAQYPLQVTFDSVPRLRPASEESKVLGSLEIDSVPSALRLLTLLCELCVRTCIPSGSSQWHLCDLARRSMSAAERTLDLLLSTTCNIPLSLRVWLVTRLAEAVISTSVDDTKLNNTRAAICSRLMLSRLQIGPSDSWKAFDADVQTIFYSRMSATTTQSTAFDVQPIVMQLRTEQWEEGGAALRSLSEAYLLYASASLRDCDVQSIVDSLEAQEKAAYYPAILLAAKARQSSSEKSAVQDPILSADTSSNEWRMLARTAVEEIIAPDVVAWMDDDDSYSDVQFMNRALKDIKARYTERPLYNTTAPGRETLARELGKLPCILVHGNAPDCCSSASRLSIASLDAYLEVASKLLDGNTKDAPAKVRQAVYVALSSFLTHYSCSSESDPGVNSSMEMVQKGLKDSDRSVRLAAGQSAVELVRLYQRMGPGLLARIEPLFTAFLRILDNNKNDRIKETLITTLGRIGRVATLEILGQTIYCLVSPLSQKNPLVKASVHVQLRGLANFYKKTPYGLVDPFLPQLAPFLVSRIISQPTLISETCRFLGLKPDGLIYATLNYTLPQLFATYNDKAIKEVVAQIKENVVTLFMEYAQHILAFAFRLQAPGQTYKVLNFTVGLLKDMSQSDLDLDVSSLVASCRIQLFTELVIALGDEDPDLADYAKQALRKAELALRPPATSARSSPGQNISALLSPHVLGIIAGINDQLQFSKRTVESKRAIIRSIGGFAREMGSLISLAAPQIMTTLQTMLVNPDFTDVTLRSWREFLATLDVHDLGPYVGPTSAFFVMKWPMFSSVGKEDAKACIDYIVCDMGVKLGASLDEVVDLTSIPQLAAAQRTLATYRKAWGPRDKLEKILYRSASENVVVCIQALQELKAFMTVHEPKYTRSLASGDYFDPLVGRIVSALFAAACRDGEDADSLRTCVFECLGILGAVDPDRFELSSSETKIVVWENFVEETESFSFVLHLIADVLVGAFRSTSDIKYQGHLAFAIQELMRFCKFSPGLVSTPGSTSSISLKVRLRWDSLPKNMLGTLSPLLSSRYTLEVATPRQIDLPVYPSMKTYREWIQTWTTHLLTRTSGERASAIFNVFYPIVRDRDVGIARHLLPHLVLHVLISGKDDDVGNIRNELLVVLEDQVDADSHSTSDKKLLSAQTVFILLDHISYWRSVIPHKIARWRELSKEKLGGKSARQIADTERALIIVDSLLSNIDQNLMAKAALQCKAYARSLMNFEQQVLILREREAKGEVLYQHYERLHEIYAHLDEPDGMEGISSLILSPSLEHQIRQHESTGRWTSAQSCWEVRLQSSPDNLEYHLGLMRCLRNLGHYDTLRTHAQGILTRYPDWESHLVGFHVESELMVGNWDEVQNLIRDRDSQASSVLIAQLLLALRSGNNVAVTDALSKARASLGSPIVAAGPRSYRRSYDAVLDLHLVHELETIHKVASSQKAGRGAYDLSALSLALSSRLNSTLPTFRTQEPILNMRRIAFSLISVSNKEIREVIGDSWLTTAKIARKAGHWQTAYSAMLQAQQCKMVSCFLESARLVRASGEHLRALQELENYMRSTGMLGGPQKEPPDDVIDLTEEKTGPNITAKAQLLRARWMSEADRYEPTYILSAFHEAVKSADKWESAQFYTGRFYDEAYKGLQTERDKIDRGMKMSLHTVRAYVRAIKHGQKFIYQTVPRLLTLWLDIGEHPEMSQHRNYGYMLIELESAIKTIPVYKWYTAFPQIVSRVGHDNKTVFKLLALLIARVIQEYPQQSLWLFVSAVKSTKTHRAQRGRSILDELQATDNRGDLSSLIKDSLRMIDPLVELCNRHVPESKKLLNMRKDFPLLSRLVPSQLIVPLQDALTASVPPASVMTDAVHQPFPTYIPTIESWLDEIEVMKSLARPKKLALRGSDGQIYMFLGKPKDDLRKDARLMDFNMIINKLLKANTESRRRQLYIRTYGVVTLNEECGFIQWVPNTVPIRPILNQYYDRLGVRGWTPEMNAAFQHIKTMTVDKEAAVYFKKHVLSRFRPMFHNWFLEQFPEPTAWLSSRLAYSRTAAVMSMVGFILGLGDRHSENILLDTTTGDVVHVDFNCLFEKGKQLETPERVPFRLTQNIIDGFGITGVEGVFRIASEVTMQLLRDNKDTLMSVLDAFIHDPLVEWEDEKRKKERESARKSRAGGNRANANDGGRENFAKADIDLRKLALEALSPIAKKLNGIYTTSRERPEKETSISNLVEMLIREASDNGNLARMYPGWGPWH